MIYSAHWDHLGIGKPDERGDTIYNGALDNATGISQLIEQARAFAHEPRTDRSVVFLAVTAEEKGLLGSEYYAQNPLFPAAKTAGVLNTDGGADLGPRQELHHLRQRQARPARHADRGRQRSRAATTAPTRTPRPATSTAPTTSPSPRSAFRRSASATAMIW